MTTGGSGRIAWAALAVLAAVFVAGSLSTAFFRSGGAPPPPPTPDFFQPVLDSLDVTEAQRARLDSIVQLRGRQTAETMDAAVRRLQALADSTAEELRSVLEPDQREAFDDLVERARQARPMRRRRPSGAGNGPAGVRR